MSENRQNKATRMFEELIQEGADQKAVQTRPVLPRTRLVVAGKTSPVSIRSKQIQPDTEKLPPIAELLPQILREVDEVQKRQKKNTEFKQSRSALPVMGEPSPEVKSDDNARSNSRISRRYNLVFGKKLTQKWKTHRTEEVQFVDMEDKAIYQVREIRKSRSIHFSWIEKPGITAWLFLLPGFLAFLLFSWLPMIKGFLISFMNYPLIGEASFAGIEHYARVLRDPDMWAAFAHGLLFCIITVGLGFAVPVVLAIFMNEMRKGQIFFKLLFFLPFLTPVVPAVILWRWIFDEGYGVLNSLISVLPLDNPHIPWLNDQYLALFSVALVFIWKNTGWNALIYLSSLQDVPKELYETAEMDGTSIWTRIRHVSLPALRGTMMVLLIMQVINSFQIFSEIYLMTGGGPGNATEVLATLIYKKSFLYLDIGYASAVSVLLFSFLLSFTVLRLKTIEEEE